MALSPTESRVVRHTAPQINAAVEHEISRSIQYHRQHRGEIGRRIAELDCEWDVERALEANAAAVIMTGIGLSALHDRRWAALSGLAAGFLLQHALQGWCPPLAVFRRLGYRTAGEIQAEKAALLALREGRDDIAETMRHGIAMH